MHPSKRRRGEDGYSPFGQRLRRDGETSEGARSVESSDVLKDAARDHVWRYMWTLHCHASVSKREQDGLREIPSQGLGGKIRGSQGVREGRVELPRPFGHRILSPARLPFRHSRVVEPLTSVNGGGRPWKQVTHRMCVRRTGPGGGGQSALTQDRAGLPPGGRSGETLLHEDPIGLVLVGNLALRVRTDIHESVGAIQAVSGGHEVWAIEPHTLITGNPRRCD
jgi:hypothetical protein